MSPTVCSATSVSVIQEYILWCWGGNERCFHALFHIWHTASGAATWMCPVPWALLRGFWDSAAVCSLDPVLSLKERDSRQNTLTQYCIGTSDVFQIFSLHSNDPHQNKKAKLDIVLAVQFLMPLHSCILCPCFVMLK